MKKKRLFNAFLAAVLTAAMTAGCGQKAAVPESEQTAVTSNSETAAGGTKKFDDVRLKVLYCWNGGLVLPEDQYNNPVAKAIRDKIGVTIEVETIAMSETEKLNMMFASGDMPDIVNAPYWGGTSGETMVIRKAAAEGRLLPIEDMLKKYPGVAKSYNVGVVSQTYLENELDNPDFGGHRYLVPQGTPGEGSENIYNWTYGIFVRGDVPKALNIDPASIKTPDQLYDFMEKAQAYGFKDVNNNPAITASTLPAGWDYSQYWQGFSKQKLTRYNLKEDGSVSPDFLEQPWMDQNMFIWKMVNSGLMDKECFKQSDTQAAEKVGNGSVLFAAAQYGKVIQYTKDTNLYNTNPEMRYVPVGPLTDRDGQALVQVEPYGRGACPAIFFPSTCSNLDAAMAYLDYVNSEEGLRLVSYGVEGLTCVTNEQGQPRLSDDLLAKKAAGGEVWKQELVNQGGFYIPQLLGYADQRKTLYGEEEPGTADAPVPEQEAYKLARPVKQFKGYPVDAFGPKFPQYNDILTFLDGTLEKEYRERAYFAGSEEEARSILQSYRDYVLAQNNGVYQKFLDFLGEQAKTREDTID